MKYTRLTAEYINSRATASGRSTAFDDFELNSNRIELERESQSAMSILEKG